MGYFSYTKEIGIWDNMDYLDTRTPFPNNNKYQKI